MGIRRSPWQIFLAAPGMIAVINSVIVGVFVGLLLDALFTFSLLICTCAGVVTFVLSVGLHLSYYWEQVKRGERNSPVHFPSQARQQ